MTRSRRLAVVAFSIIALLGAVLPALACQNTTSTSSADTQQSQPSYADQTDTSSSQASESGAELGLKPSVSHHHPHFV